MNITHGCACTRISVVEGRVVSILVPELQSNQEEADTRMILHALHASRHGHSQICIRSSDTDVEELACHHQDVIPADITIASGTRSRVRLVSIPQICEMVGPRICQVLPCLHAITGCDNVSAFVGKGKKKGLELMKDESLRSALTALGERIPPTDEDVGHIGSFVCALYNATNYNNVNKARYSLFCKSQNIQSHQLQPTRASLSFHIKRANYQYYIWKNALQATIRCLTGRGGELLNSSCVKNALPCTDACSCDEELCVNTSSTSSDDEDSQISDDEIVIVKIYCTFPFSTNSGT